MNEIIIDLGDYRTPGHGVLSGRPRGKSVREKLKLDDLDMTSSIISVIIPDDIFSINTSFFLGLFGKSVRYAGTKEKFLAKYAFQCSSEVMVDIKDDSDQALKTSNVLSRKQ